MDINSISEVEKELLAEVAKAKGKTVNELLIELGHIQPPQSSTSVEFKGQVAEAVEPQLATTPVSTEIPRFDDAIQTEFEPPPPPIAAVESPPPAIDDLVDEPEIDERLAPATFKQICVQCGWDQEQATIPEPEHSDKIAFLHAVLGQKVFSKRQTVFGGQLRLTFRTLSIREIDAMYQETFRAQKAGMISTAADYYEFLNRLRLYLQLTAMSSAKTVMQIKLPEGLNRETHPGAASYWDDFLKEQPGYQAINTDATDTPTLLIQIQDYILTHVLKTEHLQRIVAHTCNKFNRLVVKLEMSVDNPDFWEETEPQS